MAIFKTVFISYFKGLLPVSGDSGAYSIRGPGVCFTILLTNIGLREGFSEDQCPLEETLFRCHVCGRGRRSLE